MRGARAAARAVAARANGENGRGAEHVSCPPAGRHARALNRAERPHPVRALSLARLRVIADARRLVATVLARARAALLLSLGMMMYRLYTSTRPIPDHGGNVQAINSKEELVAALESAAKEKKAAVVDFYADWCGPCKQIAPDYARLSEEGAYKRAIFLKVNVDKARDAMQYAEVQCMPTFKVYAKGTKDAPETVEGADMKQVKAALDKAMKKLK